MRNPLNSAGRCVALGFTVAVAYSRLVCAADVAYPKFRAVTLDRAVQIGYGLAIADVDGDGQKDILLADKKQFVWYRNPGKEQVANADAWKKYVLAENLTARDNVCIAAQDIDGDGKCEIAVGADWAPADTENSGAVFYLIPPADRTQMWTPVKLHAEVTTHRMRWAEVEGKWGLVVAPLHGKGNKNGEGAGVKVLLYRPPASLNDPKGEWKTELINDAMHMTHNFHAFNVRSDAGMLLGGKEGFQVLMKSGDKWDSVFAVQSPQAPSAANPISKGVGEIRPGKLKVGEFLAAVEPMHGNELVVYGKGDAAGGPKRTLLTDKLVEGHALACADLLGNGGDQIVVGWRGKPEQAKGIGVAVWTAIDGSGTSWRETVVDPDNMACEDLQVADLNGDGKPDIIASGRATKNVKIYFNETAK